MVRMEKGSWPHSPCPTAALTFRYCLLEKIFPQPSKSHRRISRLAAFLQERNWGERRKQRVGKEGAASVPSIPSPSIPSPSIPSIQSSTSEARRGFSLPDSFGADLGHVLIARPRRLLAAAIGKKGSVLGSCLEHRAWMRCRPFILGSGMCCRAQDVGRQPQAMAPNEINATQRSFNPSLPIVLDFPLPARIGTQHCEQTPLSDNLEQKQILYFSLQSMGRGSAAALGSSCVCSHPRHSALRVFSSLWGFLPCNQRWRREITAVLCSNGVSDGGCRSALRRLQSKPSSPKRQRLLYGPI